MEEFRMDKIEKFYKIMNDNNMTSDDVANLFLNFYGEQLITNDFIEFIEDEGYYIGD